MKRAHAVIGANWGDEGKGLLVDYFCARECPDIVVRHSGGAQAGHTVVTPDRRRHVFHHFGSGTFLGVPTFLSRYFVVNPLLFMTELTEITTRTIGQEPKVFVDPRALVTLPFDMLINQAHERAQGRTASCGVGINETMQRSKHPRYTMTVKQMTDTDRCLRILNEYVPARLRVLDIKLEIELYWYTVWLDHVRLFLDRVTIADAPPRTDNVLFEGAQGLMLDQSSPDFPYVTHANTGIANAVKFCSDWGIKDLHTTYVTRSYFTRHGAGPLPGEEPVPAFVQDDTNINHPFQGDLRYAPLDASAVLARVGADALRSPIGIPSYDIAVTHMDQKSIDAGPILGASYVAHGPTRDDVSQL